MFKPFGVEMKMLADVKERVLVGWNGDKHCLRLKGLKREKNGQAEHAVSMPLREGQERLDIVAVPLAVDEGRKRCRPFVVGVPSEQFLHFRIVVFEQKTGDLICVVIGAYTCQHRCFTGKRISDVYECVDGRTA